MVGRDLEEQVYVDVCLRFAAVVRAPQTFHRFCSARYLSRHNADRGDPARRREFPTHGARHNDEGSQVGGCH